MSTKSYSCIKAIKRRGKRILLFLVSTQCIHWTPCIKKPKNKENQRSKIRI